MFSIVSFFNFLDVCCNFKECFKLLAEAFFITKMNTVIGKYIKGLNIFMSYPTWNVLNIIWYYLWSMVSKIPTDYCKHIMTMLLMTQNTTKVINAIFTPKYGECTIIAPFLFYYYTTISTWRKFQVPWLLD
jgi:hypothetical protein